jgi:hypothetical protein
MPQPRSAQRCLAALAAPLLLACASRGALAQGDAETVFHTATCPVPASVRGYPVSVRGAGTEALEPAYTMALAEAAARRWEVPSRRRASFQGLPQVQNRIVPPEPRWADDWFPGAEHVARLEATLYRDGREPAVRVERPSGDRLFDRSLTTIFGRSPYAHPLPPFPAGLAADSVRVLLSLGEEPQGTAAVVRFAAQQTPARMVPGTLRPTQRRLYIPPGTERSASFIKYDVAADGRISGIQVLRTTTREIGEAVVESLERASFTPAQSNCREIAQSVVQQFGGRQ